MRVFSIPIISCQPLGHPAATSGLIGLHFHTRRPAVGFSVCTSLQNKQFGSCGLANSWIPHLRVDCTLVSSCLFWTNSFVLDSPSHPVHNLYAILPLPHQVLWFWTFWSQLPQPMSAFLHHLLMNLPIVWFPVYLNIPLSTVVRCLDPLHNF